MESETKQTYPCINGLSKPPSESQMVEKKKGNFRLLKDPFLDDKVQKKVYRYDGLMPGGQSIDLKDPRRRNNPRSNPRYRLWPSRQVMDLDVPRFKYDQNYIGTPPPNEVTFTNLNDNIDSKFLGNMCKQFGSIEEIKIYHHPKTKKHMGIGKVLFTFSKCAKACVDKLHQTSKMGNIINVMIDTMGKERSRIIEEMLADKPKSARRPAPPPERIDPRSHGRLYAAASTSSNRSVASCNFTPSKSKYNDYGLEAYDPGDTEFDFGNASSHRQMVNTSLENTSYSDSDYGSMQHCDSGYSVPQSEMSFSGHSDVSSSSYDGYSQYPSQHASANRVWSCTPHVAPYSSYGVQQQYGQHNSGRQVNTSYSQQHQQHYSHTNYEATHQSCPPPEPTVHSHAESSSRSHSYSERRDEYKDRSSSSFSQHHWEKERDRETNNREKSREKEHRSRPKTPEPEEPRNQSLESRLQSIFGLGGLGSPTESNRSKDHSSPSSTPRSRDELCTPSPGVDSRFSSSQQYPVPSRASSSGSSSHVIQMPPLPPDNEEETKLPPTPTSKSDSSDRPDYNRESSSRTKRFEFKNSLDHSDSISQLKTDKLTSAIPSNSGVSSTSRYRSESNEDNNCSNGLLVAPSGDFSSITPTAKTIAAGVTPPLPKSLPVEEKSEEKENDVDMEIDKTNNDDNNNDEDDDDDDRMSLSSISSGEEKLEVNVQLPTNDGKFTTNNFQSMSSNQASRAAPPVPLITDFSRPPPGMQPWSFSPPYSFGNYSATPARMDLITGTFNQSYCSQIPGSLMPMSYTGQSFTEASLSQTTGSTGRTGDHLHETIVEEKDPNDKTFLFVLDHFVRELKEVMQKDLCKKMVENSAFKSFELWWDTEEQKSKFQKDTGPNDKTVANKESSAKGSKPTINTQQSGTQLTSGRTDVNSTLASLFETQHPWRQEGGFESHYSGAHGGGFLGIRGVMPRMPSFKKKVFRPPSPPPPDDEDSKAAESFASNAEDESDDDDDDVIGSSPSTRKKNVYASDEESASEEEKSDASASEDEEEGSDESSEDESDEEASDETSDTSEEGSEEEEEEEESEAKAKAECDEAKTLSNTSESEKMVSTKEIKDQPSVENSDMETETGKIQDDSLKESSSESESEVEDSEKDTTESSSDAEPDQSILFKPQLSPIKEEEEQDEANKEEKDRVSEKPNTEYETQEKTELSAKSDADTSSKLERSMDTNNLSSDISNSDQTSNLTDLKKPFVTSAQVSATIEDNVENKEISSTITTDTITTTISDKEVSSSEIPSSEGIESSDEDTSKTDRSKAYVIPAIAEHDYVAMPPPLPVSLEIKAYDESEPIEEQEVDYDDEYDSDRTESCDEDNTPLEILMDHNYCLPPAISEVHEGSEMSVGWTDNKGMAENSSKDPALLGNSAAKAAVQDVVQKLATSNLTVDEHAAAATAAVVAAAAATVSASQAATTDGDSLRPATKKKKKRVKDSTLTDITNKSVNEHEANLVKPVVKPKIHFQPRGYQEEKQLFFDIYSKGIDQEDINYLKRTYETLLQSEDPMYDWLNDIFWVDHTHTDIPDPVPPKKKRKVDEQITPVHKTGSARTEGFYKISNREKAGYLCHANKAAEEGQQNDKKLSMTSREARHNIRRFQTNFGDLELGELFKFNQLKFRKKQLRFAKSSIHDWGLFALEPIAAEEMVIEYVGQVIRHFVADEREKQYGAQGIGSSYLFRVDNETIIDATKAGNLARFINHSCNPNCYAKIITVEAHKKIVIYSKRDIDVNEEITYDYKFPLEEEKISCLCGAQGCKGTLN